MSQEIQKGYSQHPFLRNLQILQFAVQLAESDRQKQEVATKGLRLSPMLPFLGRRMALKARPVYGRNGAVSENAGLLYEDEHFFRGRAQRVGYSPVIGSIFIALTEPGIMLEEEDFGLDLAVERIEAEVPELDEALVGVLDIKRCSFEMRVIQEAPLDQC